MTNSEKAIIALKNRLYVSGWQMSHELIRIRENNDCEIHLEYVGGNPVGVGLVTSHGNLQIFVKKSYRRQGVGRKIAKTLYRRGLYSVYGIVGSREFWKKVGVECRF